LSFVNLNLFYKGRTLALWLSGSDRGCRRGPWMPCSQAAGSYHLAV